MLDQVKPSSGGGLILDHAEKISGPSPQLMLLGETLLGLAV
ncbi:MAG: hypothetical protein M0Z50_07535 [Planctomycetia bacterium]|nr:hypothetical protein [Planctomycetia bacterium]